MGTLMNYRCGKISRSLVVCLLFFSVIGKPLSSLAGGKRFTNNGEKKETNNKRSGDFPAAIIHKCTHSANCQVIIVWDYVPRNCLPHNTVGSAEIPVHHRQCN